MTAQHSGRSTDALSASGPGLNVGGRATRLGSPMNLLASSIVGSSPGRPVGVTMDEGGTELVPVGDAAVPRDAVRDEPPSACVAHATTATTVSVITAYDSISPTIARSRPRSPDRRICAKPRCPSTTPAGAKTNANTTDSVANTLVRRCCGGGAV